MTSDFFENLLKSDKVTYSSQFQMMRKLVLTNNFEDFLLHTMVIYCNLIISDNFNFQGIEKKKTKKKISWKKS